MLTGAQDRHYAFGLAMALVADGVRLDFIGSDELDGPELHGTPAVNFLNLRGSQRRDARLPRKVARVLTYYVRLLHYAARARPQVFHILWNNKVEFVDRTLLMIYYKLLGRKVVLTAHNVNAGKRDSTDTLLNRLTLRIQYGLADHIFVHTEKMRSELLEDFGVRPPRVTVIPYGINNAVTDTDLTPVAAKQRLGIGGGERTVLAFGQIAPYKGLEYLVAAFQRLLTWRGDYRLIIAGKPKEGWEKYWDEIQRTISGSPAQERIIRKIAHIPDEETELYFKAADALILPYTHIYQSGVLSLAYSFGLPVIASDVGSLREHIVEGQTGFVCKPSDPVDLATTIDAYFSSDLFKALNSRRQQIRDYAKERYSWDTVSRETRKVYRDLLAP